MRLSCVDSRSALIRQLPASSYGAECDGAKKRELTK